MKLLILLLAAVGWLYNLLLNIVKLRSTGNPTPANVADIYDSTTYQKWKQYSAAHCKLTIGFGLLSGLVTLALLFFNVYATFASLFPAGMFWQLFAVVLLEVVVTSLIDLPQSYIATMVIEEKYGFNRSSQKPLSPIRSAH